jgi:hypothetical protein
VHKGIFAQAETIGIKPQMHLKSFLKKGAFPLCSHTYYLITHVTHADPTFTSNFQGTRFGPCSRRSCKSTSIALPLKF